jgi:glutathione synthase/RimK-type ligase-like ATP-grasp enzyme
MSVLCIGSASDRTFVHTLTALRDGRAEFDALDLGQMAYSGAVEIPFGDLREAAFTLHGKRYRLGSYASVFVRTLGLANGAPSERLRSRAASQFHALSQLLSSSPVPVVNPPMGDLSNSSKVFHAAALASIAGWLIPRSCITRCGDEARRFIASCETGAIYKGAGGNVKTWAGIYDPAKDEERLALLDQCPVLFQERIDGPDVRIHIVGSRCFAEMIESPEPDYRRARGNRYSRLDLPAGIEEGCVRLTRACGKPFLGIDFRIRKATGQWFFLEANPQPGYDYYDGRAGGAISRALVEFLDMGGSWPSLDRSNAPLPPS